MIVVFFLKLVERHAQLVVVRKLFSVPVRVVQVRGQDFQVFFGVDVDEAHAHGDADGRLANIGRRVGLELPPLLAQDGLDGQDVRQSQAKGMQEFFPFRLATFIRPV